MFTGIIQSLGEVYSLQEMHDSPQAPNSVQGTSASSLIIDVLIPNTHSASDFVLGESIALNGACMTVAQVLENPLRARFFASSETLQKTHFSKLKPGKKLNIEKAATLNTSLSGHLVQGHVDGVGILESIKQSPHGHQMKVLLPIEFYTYCVKKGSITLDGVSLTINDLEDLSSSRFRDTSNASHLPQSFWAEFMLIPHTWQHTCFQWNSPGDAVHFEVDFMAKQIQRMIEPYLERLSTQLNRSNSIELSERGGIERTDLFRK